MHSADRSDPSPQGSRIAIVAAMEEELHSLRQRLRGVQPVVLASGSAVGGRLASREVLLVETGEGAVAAEKGLAALLEEQDIEALIVVGVAGALSPDLAVGDLVVASSVQDEAGALESPDPALLEKALDSESVVQGGVVSVDKIVVEPAAKLELWQSVGADAFQVVDLESATFARMAVERHIPYLVLRAVSDTAAEDLPLDFNAFRTPDGRIHRGKVARHLIFHPHLVGPLKDLRSRLRECAVSMADVVEGILRS
jgi:adenosylhomocysteine nucleosidase